MRLLRPLVPLVFLLLVFATAAQASGGALTTWGNNYFGEIGNGTRDQTGCTCVLAPVALAAPNDVVEVAATGNHRMVLRSDGTALAWGTNSVGQLGTGGEDESVPTPTPVKGLAGAIAVAAGGNHSLALLANGTVMSWGYNAAGQLGIGTTEGPEKCLGDPCAQVPVAVPGLSDVVAISAGNGFSLALLSDGSVVAWGLDLSGALGDGVKAAGPCFCVDRPVPVPGLTGVRAISAGESTGMALLDNGTVINWGANDLGQLGTGSRATEGCKCLGPVTPVGLPPAKAIAAGSYTDAAVLADGTVRAWGRNCCGELGSGQVGPDECGVIPCSLLPAATVGASEVTQLSATYYGFLAHHGNGVVQGWGRNEEGQLGDGTEEEHLVAVSSSALPPVSEVETAFFGGVAIRGPSQNLSVAAVGAGTGTVSGQGLSCSTSCLELRPQGQTAYLLAAPTQPGQFAGYSGACTGTVTCMVRLDTDQAVTATFGVPKGTRIKATLNQKKRSGRFTFATPGAITGYQCLLLKPKPKKIKSAGTSAKKKKPKFTKCKNGKAYKHLRPGRYTIKVKALDILGAEAKAAQKRFKIKAPQAKRH